MFNYVPAPSGSIKSWVETADQSGRPYYYNYDTKATVWERPADFDTAYFIPGQSPAAAGKQPLIGAGWTEEKVEKKEEKKKKPIKATEKKSKWGGKSSKYDEDSDEEARRKAKPPPKPLPPGWIECYDDSGDIFYYNKKTKVSSWERPKTKTGKTRSRTQKKDSSADEDESDDTTPKWKRDMVKRKAARKTKPVEESSDDEDSNIPAWKKEFNARKKIKKRG